MHCLRHLSPPLQGKAFMSTFLWDQPKPLPRLLSPIYSFHFPLCQRISGLFYLPLRLPQSRQTHRRP